MTDKPDTQTTNDLRALLSNCRPAINIMRQAGINETLIACVVTEIRSAAVSNEFRRIKRILDSEPPHHFPHGEIQDVIDDR